MCRQQAFISLLMLATAVVRPAEGQTTVAAPVPVGSGAKDRMSVPDFSGMWGHPYIPSFDPPLSGPGPVLNTSRWRQIFGTDGPLTPGTPPMFVSNPNKLVGDYTNPILKTQAAEAVKRHGEIELGGGAAPVPSSQCWPQPIPYIFSANPGMLLLQRPEQITMVYSDDHEVRRIRLNQPHPTQLTPSWYGDSVGHYEGDTLVIDTVGIESNRPFAMVDQYGTPYSKALHVVERYRLIDYQDAKAAQERGATENWRIPASEWTPDPNYQGKGLQLEFMVEDEGVFAMPWSATITYRRPRRSEWLEIVCAENTREYYAKKDTGVPHADKPEF
jgi:hypothetical protein